MMKFPAGMDTSSIAVLKEQFPEAFDNLAFDGFEVAADNTLGRCAGPATLFLEIDHNKSQVMGWLWLVEEGLYLGKRYRIQGPLGKGVERARHLLEATLSEELLSGGAERSAMAQTELLAAA